MKKRILTAVGILATVTALAVNLNENPSSSVLVSTFGGRDGIVLTNAIAKLGTRECMLVLDGTWYCTNSVTFPSNFTVNVTAGSTLNAVATNTILTFQTNSFLAGNQAVFTGLGTATGVCKFIHRWPAWGDTGRFVIGDGVLIDTSPTNIVANFDVTTRLDANAIKAMNLTVSNTAYITTGHVDNLTISNIMAMGAASTARFDSAWADDIYANTITASNAATCKSTVTFYARNGTTTWNMQPEASRTVTITNGSTEATIQSQFDSVGRYIPAGVTVTYQFEAGTYTLSSGLTLYGFYGGGNINVTGWTNTFASTNQTVILSHAAGTGTTLNMQGGVTFTVRGIRNIIANGDSVGFYFNDTDLFDCSYNYFEGVGTNGSAGMKIYSAAGYAWLNAVRSNRYGVYAWYGSDVSMNSNINENASSMPDIGNYAYAGGNIVFTTTNNWHGATYDIRTEGGGTINTNPAITYTW